MSDLLGGLDLLEVIGLEKLLGLAELGLYAGRLPGLSGVIVLLEGGRLVVEGLELGLGLFGDLRVVGDVLRGGLEGIGVVLIAEGVYGDLPVAGAVGAIGQLAAR